MSARRSQGLHAVALATGTLCIVLLAGCQESRTSGHPTAPQRDINTVLAAHDKQLLATPGVVGIYVGLQKDGKTSCLKVMLATADQKLARAIPHSIEGYPVVTEVTGEIQPLSKP